MRIESEYVIVTGTKDRDTGLYNVEVDHKGLDYPIILEGANLDEVLKMADLTYDYDDDVKLGLYAAAKG